MDVHGEERHESKMCAGHGSRLAEPDLLGAFAKHKQQGVDHVGLAAAVGAHNGGKRLRAKGASASDVSNKASAVQHTRSRH